MAKVRLGGASGSIRPAGMESSGTRSLATLAHAMHGAIHVLFRGNPKLAQTLANVCGKDQQSL